MCLIRGHGGISGPGGTGGIAGGHNPGQLKSSDGGPGLDKIREYSEVLKIRT